jgi:hypothetical protein
MNIGFRITRRGITEASYFMRSRSFVYMDRAVIFYIINVSIYILIILYLYFIHSLHADNKLLCTRFRNNFRKID